MEIEVNGSTVFYGTGSGHADNNAIRARCDHVASDACLTFRQCYLSGRRAGAAGGGRRRCRHLVRFEARRVRSAGINAHAAIVFRVDSLACGGQACRCSLVLSNLLAVSSKTVARQNALALAICLVVTNSSVAGARWLVQTRLRPCRL